MLNSNIWNSYWERFPEKRVKKILLISLPLLAIVVAAGLLIFPVAKMALHLDFSQEYRQVDMADRIRFRDNRSGKVYSKAFWGLCPVESRETWMQDNDMPFGVSGDEEYHGQLVEEIEETYDTQYSVSQVVLSPDEHYILFCEIEYGVNGGYSTDEEHCYYRVMDRESGEIYTIYSGYREWYQVYWAVENL